MRVCLRQDWVKPNLFQELLVQQVPTWVEVRISDLFPKKSLTPSLRQESG